MNEPDRQPSVPGELLDRVALAHATPGASRALLDRLSSLGEKKAGSDAGQKARALILERLSGLAGAEIREERFPVRISTGCQATLERGGQRIDAYLYDNTGMSGEAVSGELSFAGRRLSARRGAKVRGKIVVFRNNLLVHRLLQVPSAYQGGAAGAVIGLDNPVHIRRGLGFPPLFGPCPMPAIGISRADWLALQRAPAQGWTIRYSARPADAMATNVVVDLKGKARRREKIVLGAHYDSWHGGSQDNGVAVTLLLDLLGTLAEEQRLDHDLRAIFFDAEEIGIQGSAYHVRSNDLADYRAYLNLEMPVPTRQGRLRIFFYSGHALLRGSFSRLRLLGRGILPVPLELFYRFAPIFPADVDSFYRNGIPCGTTFCNNPNLHTPLDTVENIRMERYAAVRDFLLGMIRVIDARLPIMGNA